jgi:hypothetical protein
MPNRFETVSEAVTIWTGSTAAFITALSIVLA